MKTYYTFGAKQRNWKSLKPKGKRKKEKCKTKGKKKNVKLEENK